MLSSARKTTKQTHAGIGSWNNVGAVLTVVCAVSYTMCNAMYSQCQPFPYQCECV